MKTANDSLRNRFYVFKFTGEEDVENFLNQIRVEELDYKDGNILAVV